MLCQGEMDPFWGKGHRPTPGVKTSGRMRRKFEEIVNELTNGLG